ncbi:MAG: tRNA (N6-threonylcarbamoyladenosine(37)-N6)-methyltransferase TrmO [Clostridia bacterium]|nr:tRNA (N6-threonylcarbamoyladenosine(37)-N6)-methyltransferase TrmO [Clostridia bacterium]
MKIIGHIYNNYVDKFGIPRQSGMVNNTSKIIFEKPYAKVEAVLGLDEYSHVWLLWGFDKLNSDSNSLTVRPPKLGGNKKVGVFATRSPYRPNNIGLSVVRLVKVDIQNNCPILYVEGADILNGTPIYDIKPYIPYADCIPDAKGSFAQQYKDDTYEVVLPQSYSSTIDQTILDEIIKILSYNPRPQYQDDDRVYKMNYATYLVEFGVNQDKICIIDIKNA